MLKIVVVDDELSAMQLLCATLEEIDTAHQFEITSFTNPLKARDYLLVNQVNVVFLDVEMPVLSGMDIAHTLLNTLPAPPEIIFVTAYPQFALDAWQTDAVAYVLKPYHISQIQHALTKGLHIHLSKPLMGTVRPFARCFPEFDLFLDGYPICFSSKRAKEMLAFLVYHRGGWVSIDKLTFELLEESTEASAKSHIRLILSRLRQTLARHDLSSLLQTQYGKVRVDPGQFDCDYYNYLNGDLSLFKGSFMGAYTWAHNETALLFGKMGNTISLPGNMET